MSKLMVKDGDIWVPMEGLKGDTGPLPADESIPDTALVTDGAKTNTAYLMGNRMVKDAEGEFISVDDSYPSAALSLTVDGKSTQNGTPTPDAPVEIVSVDDLSLEVHGKNLIPTTMPDNAIHAQMSGAIITSAGNAWVFALPCARNTDYYFSSSTNGTIGVLGLSTSLPELNGAYTRLIGMANYKNRAISTGENDYILIQVANTAQFDAIATNQGQLELGSTATDYEPYLGATVTLDLSDEPLRSLPDGTKDELHLTYIRPSTREGWAYYRGEKVKRIQLVDMGTLNWANYYGNRVFFAIVPNMANGYPYALQAMCEIFATWTNNTLAWFGTRAPANAIALQNNLNRVSVNLDPADAYESVAAFKADMSGVFLHCPLATPETIDLGIFELPAMQSGTTHLWSDPSTSLSVTYERDRNIVISNLEAAAADLATS